MDRSPYPLQWPDGWPRTPPQDRERSRFTVGLADAIDDLLRELDLLNASHMVITSDLPTSERTGLPYANGRAEDPGIAIWCVVKGQERVFACDRWTTPAANLRAIGKTIESLRGLERWGAADMVTRAFQGFALPPPSPGEPLEASESGAPDPAPNPPARPGKRPWRYVLCLAPIERDLSKRADARARSFVLERAKRNYREMIRRIHPDAGGDNARAAELNVAMQEAEAELGKPVPAGER